MKDNVAMMTKLRSWGIAAAAPKKPYVHAKVAVVDGKWAYVGSANFTANSLDHNREVGLILPLIGARTLTTIFERDFEKFGGNK